MALDRVTLIDLRSQDGYRNVVRWRSYKGWGIFTLSTWNPKLKLKLGQLWAKCLIPVE